MDVNIFWEFDKEFDKDMLCRFKTNPDAKREKAFMIEWEERLVLEVRTNSCHILFWLEINEVPSWVAMKTKC